MEKDFLDEVIAERTRRNPRFPNLVDEAGRRRDLARRLSEERRARGISQTVLAARMRTAASVVSKLETGGDVRLSTLQRYCAAMGRSLAFVLSSDQPPRRRARSARKGA